MEYIKELHERLSNAILDELARIKAPQYVFDLFYGIDFLSVYQREIMSYGSTSDDMEKDLTSFIQLSVNALTISEKPLVSVYPASQIISNRTAESSDGDDDGKPRTRSGISPEMEVLCLEWVNRPAIPNQKMEDFLREHQGRNNLPDFISPTSFKRALQLMGTAGKIRKGETGRWEQH